VPQQLGGDTLKVQMLQSEWLEEKDGLLSKIRMLERQKDHYHKQYLD